MNPMLTSIQGNAVRSPVAQQVGQLQAMMTAVKNPGVTAKGAIMAQIQNHPLYQQAKQIADRYNGDWNLAFEETARSNGIDPNQITSMLRQQGLVK